MSVATSIVTIADLLEELGGVPPDRVRLVPTPGTATEQDVIRIWEREKRLCELVDGTLLEKTVGAMEAYLPRGSVSFFWEYLKLHNVGFCMGADGMVRLAPGLVRIPDLSFVSWDRVPCRKVPKVSIFGLAPDLAVEVLSPSNTKAEMDRKLEDYFAAGIRLVWYVDPKSRTVDVFTGPGAVTTLGEGETLDGGQVLPGFALSLEVLFSQS